MKNMFSKLYFDLFKLRGKYNNINITGEEIILLSYIMSLSSNGCCSASSKYLAEGLNVPIRNLERQLKKLRETNLIKLYKEYDGARVNKRLLYVQFEQIQHIISENKVIHDITQANTIDNDVIQNDSKEKNDMELKEEEKMVMNEHEDENTPYKSPSDENMISEGDKEDILDYKIEILNGGRRQILYNGLRYIQINDNTYENFVVKQRIMLNENKCIVKV